MVTLGAMRRAVPAAVCTCQAVGLVNSVLRPGLTPLDAGMGVVAVVGVDGVVRCRALDVFVLLRFLLFPGLPGLLVGVLAFVLELVIELGEPLDVLGR